MKPQSKPIAILLAALTTLLTGCLATTDLSAEDAPISNLRREQARTMLDLLHTKCVRTSKPRHEPGPEQRVKIVDRGAVKRLYHSDSAWLKAEIVAQNTWGDVYYNQNTKEFICGSSSWNQKQDVANIRFTEIQPEERAVNQSGD